jgi:hypothetical protein
MPIIEDTPKDTPRVMSRVRRSARKSVMRKAKSAVTKKAITPVRTARTLEFRFWNA